MRYLLVVIVLLFNAVTGFSQTQEAWRARFSNPPGTATTVTNMKVSPGGDCYLAVRNGVVKYGPSGTQQWFRSLGDSPTEITVATMTLGSGDVVYVAGLGYISNTVQMLTFAISPAGERLWTGYVESTGEWGEPRDIQVDSAGNVYVCGHDYGDVFLLKYSPQGAFLWKRTYYDFNLDIGEAMTIDASGNVCIAASSWFLELYTWVITLKYNGNGDLLWADTLSTGTLFPAPYYAIATDASNNVVVGTTGRRDYNHDFLVLKYRVDGTPLWTNFYAGPAGEDILVDIAVDERGNVYATGVSANVQDQITTLKFGPDGGRHWTARDHPFVPSTSGSSPVGIVVHEDGHVYVGGNATTAQGVDFVALKYATNGTLLWSVPVHNAAYGIFDTCREIEMDADGAIYLTGLSSQSSTESEVFTVKLEQTDLTNFPVIIEPPRSATIVLTANPPVATFSVSASSDTPLTFQWRRDGAIIAGATNSTYSINGVTEQDEGGYSVIVSNAFGRVVTAEATLDVKIPPSIVSQPRDETIPVDRVISLYVQAIGDSPLFFQWQFNGENIPNATNSSISFNPVRLDHAGVYRVIVSNAVGVAISDGATLIVTERTKLDRWTWRHPIPTNLAAPNLHAITEGRNRLVAVGNLGTILVSIDGITWTNITTPVDEDLRGIAFGRDTFVAVGFAGTLATSRDGFSWEVRTVATNDLYGVAFLNDRFIAVGESGTIVTSTNGLEWFTPPAVTAERLKDVAYGQGLYIATGRDGTFARSYDATNWMASSDEQRGDLKGIAFTNGLFAAVSPDNFLTSTNGTNWSVTSFIGLSELENTAYAEGQHVVAGQQGLVMTRRPVDPGWKRQLVPTGKTIRDLIYTRGCVWAVGNDGLILQSGQLRPYLRAVPNGAGNVALNIFADPGETVYIEASPDLRDWEEVATLVGEDRPVVYRENAEGLARFYRLRD